jgi:hypothetical protein
MWIVGIAYIGLGLVAGVAGLYGGWPNREIAFGLALLFVAGGAGLLYGTRSGLAFALPGSLAGVLTASLFVGALLPVLGRPREEQSVIGFLFSALVLVVCAATSVVIVRALIRRA